MRRWNPSGNWQLENSARIIFGYVAASTTYSCQQIFGTSRGGQSQVCYNSGVEYRGLRFNVPVGVHQLIVEKVRTGERDTVALLAACLKPETIRRTVSLGSNATYCASLTDLLGTLTTTRNICPRPASTITFGTPATTCIRYTGTAIGTDTACVQVCDRYGFCDTTYLIVTAATSSTNLALTDTISVGLRRTTCELVLPTGTITSFTNTCPSNSGTNASFQLDAGTNCVTYRGLTVGTDTACLRVCNTEGSCTTTTLTVTTVPYVNPATQTSFAYLDTITVGLTRAKCSFNAPTGAITVFENLCANTSGTNVAFTLDQATKCVNYRSVAIGVDTACIRVCNASGQCDTTYMYIGAIVNGTGGGTNNGNGRTIIVRDTISIGLSRENCGVSVPATILSITNNCLNSSGTNVAFSIDAVRRCVTYRGLTIGADTACYVVCNASGVCDTTQYIVNAVDTTNRGKTIVIRDTISVGVTRNDCRVSIPRGTFSSITNNCPSSSGTNISFAFNSTTRCVDFSGLLVGADTACIIVCNTAGICDTTLYIITAIENTSGGNRCGLRVSPTVQVRSCGIMGFINLAVSGSTAPYSFRWADLIGTNQPQNRTGLEAGTYTVIVSSAASCDTTLNIVVANNAINCGGGGTNRCGLAVSPAVIAKTCAANGSITLGVSGSTAPYTFDWTDLVGTNDPQNRTNLEAGVYSVKVTPSVPNCDTTIAVVVANNATNCGGGSGNRCGLVVTPTVVPKTCAANGSITLNVSGSTAPYNFNWADLAGTNDPQNRTNLEAGRYSVAVSPAAPNCDTIVEIVILNNAVNCGSGSNRCGLIVTPTATPKTCTTNGSITLAISGSTAPYTYDWTDLTGTNDPQNRTNLNAGTYTVKVTPSVLNCDTTLSVIVANNTTNCGSGSNIRFTTVNVVEQDSTTFCVDSSRVAGGFTVILSSPQVFSTIAPTPPTGCFKIKGFVTGRDTAIIILIGTNGTRDTTQLVINVTPRNIGSGCGLIVTPSATPKTCATNGTITLVVNGSTAPYTFDWTDLVGTNDPQNRTNLQAGTYTVKVKSSALNCDTTLRITVANDSINCPLSRSRVDSVTVFTQDSTTYCVDSSRVTGGFTIFISGSQIFSTIAPTTPKGCFKIKGFVAGRDSALIVLNGANGFKDTLRLIIKVVPKPILLQRSDTITIKILETRTYCPDTARLRGSPVNLIKFCSIDPFNNTRIRLDTVTKCVAITGISTGQDTFCVAVCNAAGFCDTTKLFVNVTRDTVTPQYRTDTVRLFIGDSLTYCNIDTGMIRGAVDSIYNHCFNRGSLTASVSITAAKCLKIKGLAVGKDSACIVVLNRLFNLNDTTKVIIIVTKRDTSTNPRRTDSITVQVGETRTYCVDTSRLRGARVTSIATCLPVLIDNSIIFIVDSTKCVDIDGLSVGRDTVCLRVCNANNVCDTTLLFINVVPQRPLASSTVLVPVQLSKDSIFCGVDISQIRGRVDTIYDACPAKNGSKARMVIDNVTKCVKITGVNVGRDTMCVVVCNTASRICDTTFVVAVVTDTAGGRIIVIANDDFDSLRRGTNKTLELYNNDTIRPRRATSLTIVKQPVKGTVDTISFANGLVKYTAGRSPSSCGLDSFRYRVCLDTVCDTALVVILVVCPDSLQVWKAISPNGDGKNDVLLVEGLQNYPNHTVCVFNRWGNQVLNQKNYQNDWQGTWNGTNVPDGTYYYFVRNDDNGEMLLTGYVQILR